jgi:hypothetical protein
VNEDTTKLVPIRIKDKNGNLVEGTLTVREALDNFNKAMNRKPSQAQIKKTSMPTTPTTFLLNSSKHNWKKYFKSGLGRCSRFNRWPMR